MFLLDALARNTVKTYSKVRGKLNKRGDLIRKGWGDFSKKIGRGCFFGTYVMVWPNTGENLTMS